MMPLMASPTTAASAVNQSANIIAQARAARARREVQARKVSK